MSFSGLLASVYRPSSCPLSPRRHVRFPQSDSSEEEEEEAEEEGDHEEGEDGSSFVGRRKNIAGRIW